MRLRALLIGTVSGLLIGGIIGVLLGPRSAAPPVPLGEDHGRISEVVMQYQPAAGALVAPIYAQFLSAIGSDVHVVWVVGKASDVEDLRSRLGKCWPAGRCRTVVVGKEISTWAKDRFVAMSTPGAGMLPCSVRRGARGPPTRCARNDQEVPYRLAQDAHRLFRLRGTDIDFDGGDFLATARHLFASPAIFEKNTPGAGVALPLYCRYSRRPGPQAVRQHHLAGRYARGNLRPTISGCT